VAITKVPVNDEQTVVSKIAPDLADKPNRDAKVSGANQTRVSENRLLIRDRPGRSGLEPTLTCVDDDIALIVIWIDTGHDD
jgi:hypothetical protein